MNRTLSDYAASVIALWWACPELTILGLCGLWLHYDWDLNDLDTTVGCCLLILLGLPWLILLVAILINRGKKVP